MTNERLQQMIHQRNVIRDIENSLEFANAVKGQELKSALPHSISAECFGRVHAIIVQDLQEQLAKADAIFKEM